MEFDINKYVLETLKPLDIPVFFVSRKETNLPLVVFNVTSEKSFEFWDDEETMIVYKVTVNIFSKGNYIEHKNKIKNLMKQAGFKRTDIPECIYHEDVGVYNQPMFFQLIKEK